MHAAVKEKVYWYNDAYFRITLDANIGGAICDLRPHAGRVIRNLGPDTESLHNMNYPFSISSEYRGGVHEGAIHTFKIRVDGKESSIALSRTQAEPFTDGAGNPCVRFTPAKIRVGSKKVEVESIYRFIGQGMIEISRKLIDAEPETEVIFTEYHCGSWGDSTYPEDMRSLVLYAGSQKMDYQYAGRVLEAGNCEAGVWLKPLQCTISMAYDDPAMTSRVREGYVFRPFYWLEAERAMKAGEEMTTCLKIRQAD